ncbi:MAG: proline dehydrogenase family protein [Elusimicrobiota bacterium]
MGRKLSLLALVFALPRTGPASAQTARLSAVSAPVMPALAATPAGLAAPALPSALAAVPSPGAALSPATFVPVSAAAPASALAAPPASAAEALGAAAAVSAKLADPDRADGGRAQAGRSFDLSAENPAVGLDAVAETRGPSVRLAAASDGRRSMDTSAAAKAAPPGPVSTQRPPVTRFILQVLARARTLAERTVSLPAHFWPFSSLARVLAHGEPLVGLTPAGAARAVEKISARDGVVIGRLAWELRDAWSVRGAERSYLSLIDELSRNKSARRPYAVAVSVDAESLGLDLRGVSAEERMETAVASILRITRAAKGKGLPVELDMGTASAMPSIVRIATRVVRETGMPVRLALSARYRSSFQALRDWAALARETGLKLGVRLVKGSFIEGNQPDAINLRRPLLRRYKKLITLALERANELAVAVASQNDEIWEHAQTESRRLGAPYAIHVIRGVNAPLQAKMRAAGKIERVYVSYGIDAPVMGLTELYTNWKQKRALAKRSKGQID